MVSGSGSDDHLRRRSTRLPGYDYSRHGAYFATVCTRRRVPLFGDVVDGEMRLNGWGRVVEEEWLRSAEIRREIVLDAYVIMPNHMHAIIFIVSDDPGRGDRPVAPTTSNQRPKGPLPKSLSSLMAGFKSAVTKRINTLRGTPGTPVWQRNYYEHIIRNERELARIRRCMLDNPARPGGRPPM